MFVCGIAILILGSAANILAEEAYSETHVDPAAVPLNLKELDAKYNSVKQLSPVKEEPNNNNQEMIGDNSLQDLPLSKNRSACVTRFTSRLTVIYSVVISFFYTLIFNLGFFFFFILFYL